MIGPVLRDDNTAGVDGAVQILTSVLTWFFGVGAPSSGLSRVGLFGHVSLLRLIEFVGLGRTLFDDAYEGERLRQTQETKSKAGPKNPTLPIGQNREGWGTHFKSFGKSWATRLLISLKSP